MDHAVLLKHVRMPADELLDHVAERVVDRELARFGGDLRKEYTFEDVVANLFFERRRVGALDRVDYLVGFFEHERREGVERLLAIPGTSLW